MLQLPTGYDSFGKIRERNLHFVDKSLFIKEILDDIGTEVTVITRPRRFGKTLNLSMLQHFLSNKVNGVETNELFHGLKIMQTDKKYTEHQGKYPVIFLTLKDIEGTSFELAYANLSELICRTYRDHRYLVEGNTLDPIQKKIFQSILEETADVKTIQSSLLNLCEYLFIFHQTQPWLLIDEYDKPLQSAYLHGYYNQMIDTLRSMFSKALKTNPFLNRAVITGILRIAKESLFSGVNNLKIYSVLHKKYSDYFGFTEQEVTNLLNQSDLSNQSSTVKEWYNGYQIGNTTLYNPWSIVNYIQDQVIDSYWVNTSGNDLIRSLIIEADDEFKDQLNVLLQGKSITQMIDEKIVFLDLQGSNMAIWGLLLFSGYLKVVSETLEDDGLNCSLMIPNREVRNLFRQIITQWISKGKGIEWMKPFIQSLLDGNMEQFETSLTNIMEQTVSYHDTSKYPEAFYHGMMIGLTAILYNNPDYHILSNRESGFGLYDYMILSKDINKPTIIFELKKSESEKFLQGDAQKALEQIQSHHYFAQAQQNGNAQVICIGLAFHKKYFCMQHAILNA